MTDDILTDKELERLKQCFDLYENKGWEPRGGTKCKPIQRYVNAGYLKIVDGRCGFELFKDTHVTWTQAGRRVMELLDSIEDQRLEAAFNDF